MLHNNSASAARYTDNNEDGQYAVNNDNNVQDIEPALDVLPASSAADTTPVIHRIVETPDYTDNNEDGQYAVNNDNNVQDIEPALDVLPASSAADTTPVIHRIVERFLPSARAVINMTTAEFARVDPLAGQDFVELRRGGPYEKAGPYKLIMER